MVILAKSHPGCGRMRRHPGGGVPAHDRRGVRLRRGLEPVRGRLHPLLPGRTPPRRRSAGGPAAGLFLSCVVLEIAGAASATAASAGASLGDPTGTFTGHLPTALADLTLLAIALGAVCANVLNIYSGAMSFVAIGIKLPLALRRAIVALVVGVIGFIVALTGLHDAGAKYTELPADHRLLDRALAGGHVLRPVPVPPPEPGRGGGRCCSKRSYSNWAGPVAMLVGMACPSGCSPTRPSTSAWSPRTCPRRRHHLRGRVRHHRRGLPDLACDRRTARSGWALS